MKILIFFLETSINLLLVPDIAVRVPFSNLTKISKYRKEPITPVVFTKLNLLSRRNDKSSYVLAKPGHILF